MADRIKVYLTGYSWCDNEQSAYTSTGPGGLRDGTFEAPTTGAFDERLLKGQYGADDKRPILYLDCELLTGSRRAIKKYIRLEDKCGHGWYWTHVTILDEVLSRVTTALTVLIDAQLQGAPVQPSASETAERMAARLLKQRFASGFTLVNAFKPLLGYAGAKLNAPAPVSAVISSWMSSALAPYCGADFLNDLIQDKENYLAKKKDWKLTIGNRRQRLNEFERTLPGMKAAVDRAVQRILSGEAGTRIVLDIWQGYNHFATTLHTGDAMAILQESSSREEKIFPYIKGQVVDDATGKPVPVADASACLDTKGPTGAALVSGCTGKIYSQVKVSLSDDPSEYMFTSCNGEFALVGRQALGSNETYTAALKIEDTTRRYQDIDRHEIAVMRAGTYCVIRLKQKAPAICRFKGIVVDGSAPGEKGLPFVNVSAQGPAGYKKEMRTKADGRYELAVPYGSLQLVLSYPHWHTVTESVSIDRPELLHTTRLIFNPNG